MQIDLAALSFSDKPVKRGLGQTVWAHVQPSFALPCLVAPFGLSCWKDTHDPKYTLALSLTSEAEAFLSSLDARLLEIAQEHSQEWFGGKAPGVIEALHTTIVKPAADSKYLPTMRLPLHKESSILEGCVDPLDIIPQRSTVFIERLRLRGIWIAAGKWGPMLSIEKMSIAKPETRPEVADYAFLD